MHQRAATARLWRTVRFVGDLAIASGALYAAFWLRIVLPIPFTEALLPSDRLTFLASEWTVVVASQLLLLYFFGFYDPPRPRPRLELARRLSIAILAQGLALTAYFFLSEHLFPRSVLVLFLALNALALFAWRSLLQRVHRAPKRNVALIGAGSAARELAESINLHHWHGLKVAGYVLPPREPAPPVSDPGVAPLGPFLGTFDDLPALLAGDQVDDLIMAGDGPSWQTELIGRLAAVRQPHTNLLLLPGPFESLIGRMRYRWVNDIPLIEVVRESEWRLNWPLKRTLDLVVGGLLTLPALPLMGLCALLVRFLSPGPIFYRQVRVGRGQRLFTLWKFRTMQIDAERDTGEILAQLNDPRSTGVGAILRRLRLDELPQLFNVLGGTMSLVGPRPERPGFAQRYLAEVPGYGERFSVAPGLTGLAQVNGDYHSSAANKLRYDLAYIANWNLWLDLSILFRTVKIVLTSRGV